MVLAPLASSKADQSFPTSKWSLLGHLHHTHEKVALAASMPQAIASPPKKYSIWCRLPQFRLISVHLLRLWCLMTNRWMVNYSFPGVKWSTRSSCKIRAEVVGKPMQLPTAHHICLHAYRVGQRSNPDITLNSSLPLPMHHNNYACLAAGTRHHGSLKPSSFPLPIIR